MCTLLTRRLLPSPLRLLLVIAESQAPRQVVVTHHQAVTHHPVVTHHPAVTHHPVVTHHRVVTHLAAVVTHQVVVIAQVATKIERERGRSQRNQSQRSVN